ncbi:MAG: exodeoxyribonuclease VII large subunit, partial [Burkholderiaceae bacterium]
LHPHERHAARLAALRARLAYAQPRLEGMRGELDRKQARLADLALRHIERRRQRLDAASQTLQALSPRNILDRGYAIVRDESGNIVKNALDLSVGDQLNVELGRGRLQVDVLQAHGLL